MKYLSLFSGIGGFELGIQQAYEKNLATINRSKDGRGEEDETNDDEERERLESETWKDIDTTNRPLGEYNNRHSRGQEPPTCIGYSEIDKYAIQIYQKHFPNHKNYGDIKTIDASKLPDFDLLVGGFPCQSFSIAGKRRGFEERVDPKYFLSDKVIKSMIRFEKSKIKKGQGHRVLIHDTASDGRTRPISEHFGNVKAKRRSGK